jgi:hypothetical protein
MPDDGATLRGDELCGCRFCASRRDTGSGNNSAARVASCDAAGRVDGFLSLKAASGADACGTASSLGGAAGVDAAAESDLTALRCVAFSGVGNAAPAAASGAATFADTGGVCITLALSGLGPVLRESPRGNETLCAMPESAISLWPRRSIRAIFHNDDTGRGGVSAAPGLLPRKRLKYDPAS